MQTLMMVAADYASIESSGKINILGIFHSILVRDFPTLHQSMHLVIQLKPELGEFGDTRTFRIEFVDMDGQKLFELAKDFHIDARDHINFIIGIRDLPLPNAGSYEFRLFIDKDQKHALELDAIKIESREA
jgi:hypothetical protein